LNCAAMQKASLRQFNLATDRAATLPAFD